MKKILIHSMRIMPGNYICPTCSGEFSRLFNLKRHTEKKHPYNMLSSLPQNVDNNRYDSEIVSTPSLHLKEERKYPFEFSNYPAHMLPPVPVGHFLPWKHPFTCLIAGPSGSGKTMFVKRFLENIREMVTPIPDRVIWCYGEYQTMYGFIDNVDFHEGLPNLKLLDVSLKHLIVIDDLMMEVNATITSLFTKGSHHRNISVMYIVQNIFHQNKEHRNISLNAQYIVLMKNPRDSSQIRRLSQQIYPGGSTLLREAYETATSEAHGYLVIDLKQDTDENHRLRTHIFPGQYQLVYTP